MKKVIRLILTILLFSLIAFLLPVSNKVNAQQDSVTNIHFFYGIGCPHCAKEDIFLEELKLVYGDRIQINEYEVYYNQENQKLFNKVIDYFDINLSGVPFTVIGEKYFIGYGSDETTGVDLKKQIDRCLETDCKNVLDEIISEEKNNKEIIEEKEENTTPMYFDSKIFGKVDLKSISLPIATILIAVLDGFNPCAMWILIFLITMLINMKNRKRLLLLGSIFIITSGLVYFVFLAAWLNFFKFIGFVYWIKAVIGVIAIVSGVLHIRDALSSKGECRATNEKKRESIMERIKRVIAEKSLILSITGIVILAVSVNLIEVVCSAGLPAIYTNLLSSIDLSISEYYAYLLLYIVIFMLDDLLVFFLAVKTLEVTGIAKKYTKWTGLVGGVIIFILGIILIFKPELLMFG